MQIVSGNSLGFGDVGTGVAVGWAGHLATLYARRCDVLNRGFSGYNSRHVLELLPTLFPQQQQHTGSDNNDGVLQQVEPAFCTVWLGATRFVPGLDGFGSETKFGAGIGLGVKTFPVKNVGLRFEARGFYTLVKGEGGAFCANGTCLFAFSGTGLWQGDVSAGLILAF